MIGLVFLMPETQLRVTYPVTLEELKEALRREKSPKIRERIRIVLHVKSGLSGRKTAKLMGLSRDTVRRWVKRFNEKGFEGLKDRPRKGGEPKIDHKKSWKYWRLVLGNSATKSRCGQPRFSAFISLRRLVSSIIQTISTN